MKGQTHLRLWETEPATPGGPTGMTAYPMPPVYRVQLVREATTYGDVEDPNDVAEILARHLDGADREHLVVIGLNAKSEVIGINTVHIGGLTSCIVCPRDVLKAVILMNASSMIVGHNHPSGDPTPSPEDLHITRKLKEAGALFEIPLLDHIVIGDRGRWRSIRTVLAHTEPWDC